MLGNIGTSSDKAAAFPSIVLLRQYVLEPGYYPQGGIQAFPNALIKYFKDKGGTLRLSAKVSNILTKENRVEGVLLDQKTKIKADIVVSNADATETFKNFLDVKTKESAVSDKLKVTPSMFLVYLGLDGDFKNKVDEGCNLYYFSDYDIDKAYSNLEDHISRDELNWLVCSFPSAHDITLKPKKNVLTILTFAPYKSMQFWAKNKDAFGAKMINKAEQIIPGLKSHIKLKFFATPITLSRYTSNREGAFAGWLSIKEQLKVSLLPQRTSLKGLYLVGHWCTLGYLPSGGISNVASSGRRAARFILNDLGKDWKYDEFYL